MKKKIKICIVRSKYNETSELLKSATNELIRRRISYKILEDTSLNAGYDLKRGDSDSNGFGIGFKFEF